MWAQLCSLVEFTCSFADSLAIGIFAGEHCHCTNIIVHNLTSLVFQDSSLCAMSTTYIPLEVLQVWIFHHSCYKGCTHRGFSPCHNLACISLSLRHSLSNATSTMENDSSTPPSRKCAASSALQLGPRKKACTIIINLIFLTVNLFYIRTTQDLLMHHGHHFSRTVNTFCNVQTLITNGLQAMCNNAPEDESLTSLYIAYFLI